jgi:hypothetical protein
MTTFTTRVELQDAGADDYEDLHAEMEVRGFARTIKANSGVTYQLPTAEYNWVGTATRDQVCAAAKAAAKAVGRKAAVLVTESAGRQFSGLDVAE